MSELTPLIPWIAAIISGTAIAGLGYLIARRAGLGPVQAEYISTLHDLNASLDRKLADMADRLNAETKARDALAKRVQHLEATIVDLTTANHDLRAENARLRGEIAP